MRAILVSSGDDYAALQFEDTFSGTSVKEILDNPRNYECNIDSEDEEGYWEIQIIEIGEVDPLFLNFVRNKIQDYEDSKHTNFWIENETI